VATAAEDRLSFRRYLHTVVCGSQRLPSAGKMYEKTLRNCVAKIPTKRTILDARIAV